MLQIQQHKETVENLEQFIDNIQQHVDEKFDEFDENLKIKYHQYRIQINQLISRKNFYEKNLKQIEESYKIKNDFDKLRNELTFFKEYSQSIDRKLDDLKSQIKISKEKAQKKQEYVDNFQKIFKSLNLETVKNYKFYSVLKDIKNLQLKQEKEEENKIKKPSFFLTENRRMQQVKRKKSIKKSNHKNCFVLYNQFKDFVNIYFRTYLTNLFDSKRKDFFKEYLFEIIKSLKQNQICTQTIGKLDLFQILQYNHNIKIQKLQSSQEQLTQLSQLLQGIQNDKIYQNFDIQNFEHFKLLNHEQIFAIIIFRMPILQKILKEWEYILNKTISRTKNDKQLIKITFLFNHFKKYIKVCSRQYLCLKASQFILQRLQKYFQNIESII